LDENMTGMTKRNTASYRRLKDSTIIRSGPFSAREIEASRNLSGVAFEGFVEEIRERRWGFVKSLISPSERRGAALDLLNLHLPVPAPRTPASVDGCFWASREGNLGNTFFSLQRLIREAGESGDWKRAVLYAILLGQLAVVSGLDFIPNDRSKSRVGASRGGSGRFRHAEVARRAACESVEAEFQKWRKNRRPRHFKLFWPAEAGRIVSALAAAGRKDAASTLYRDSGCKKLVTAARLKKNIRDFKAGSTFPANRVFCVPKPHRK
jgi:hypothetical protein